MYPRRVAYVDDDHGLRASRAEEGPVGALSEIRMIGTGPDVRESIAPEPSPTPRRCSTSPPPPAANGGGLSLPAYAPG